MLDAIYNLMNSTSDFIKTACSYALGNLTVGNISTYLPQLLNWINNDDSRRYLLLSALKEVIIRHCINKEMISLFLKYVDIILPILLKHSINEEEGIRVIIAECLGSLAIIDTSKLYTTFIQLSNSKSIFIRSIVMNALRSSIHVHTDLNIVKQYLGQLLLLLKDEDLVNKIYSR
jgi:cullin-associated NEDD8-dissociated protein 1